MVKKRWFNMKEAGLSSLKMFQHLQKAHDAKFKNWLLGNSQNPGNFEENELMSFGRDNFIL